MKQFLFKLSILHNKFLNHIDCNLNTLAITIGTHCGIIFIGAFDYRIDTKYTSLTFNLIFNIVILLQKCFLNNSFNNNKQPLTFISDWKNFVILFKYVFVHSQLTDIFFTEVFQKINRFDHILKVDAIHL